MISLSHGRQRIACAFYRTEKPSAISTLQFCRSMSSLHSLSKEKREPLASKMPVAKKRLDIAIVGLPNAGKSQLINVLTETSVSAVSQKRHTTVKGVLGARTVKTDRQETQLLFVDTPGFLRAGDAVDRDHIETLAQQEMRHVDHTLVVVDAARRLTEDVKESLIQLMLKALESEGRMPLDEEDEDDSDSELDEDPLGGNQKLSVVLNKVDLVHPKSDLLDTAMEIGELVEQCIRYQMAQRSEATPNEDTVAQIPPEVVDQNMPIFFYASALKTNNAGVEDVLKFLLDRATACKSFELEPGEATTLTPEERVEEVVREKLYRCLHNELPYQLRQRNRLFQVIPAAESGGTPGLIVHQDILVRTKSHRDIVRGRGNRTLQHIQDMALRDLQRMFRCPIDLHLHVKLIKSKQGNWSV
jgi:GTP-binding protein Era